MGFREAVRAVIASDDGMCVTAERVCYVRSFEGEQYCSGAYDVNGGMEREVEHAADVDGAVDRFLELRRERDRRSATKSADEVPDVERGLQMSLEEAVIIVLKADDGLEVESEGTLYVRTLIGGKYVVGEKGLYEHIDWERKYGTDLRSAVDRFLAVRKKQTHGRAGWVPS